MELGQGLGCPLVATSFIFPATDRRTEACSRTEMSQWTAELGLTLGMVAPASLQGLGACGGHRVPSTSGGWPSLSKEKGPF